MIEFNSDIPISTRPVPVVNRQEPSNTRFVDRLRQAIQQVNDLQHRADNASEQVAQGKLGIHEGMMALTAADLSLRLMLQVRSKVINAYNEISRMQF